MKGRLAMISMMAAFASIGMSGPMGSIQEYVPSKKSEENRKRRLAKADEDRKKANGLKEFEYPQGKILALNQKSADRKAKRNNWI